MAFVRKAVREDNPATGSGRISIGPGRILRWVAIPGIGLALASWSIAVVAGLHSAQSLASATNFAPHPLALHANPGEVRTASAAQAARQAGHLALVAAAARLKDVSRFAKPPVEDPFEKAVAQASLSPDKVLAAFASAGMKRVSLPAIPAKDDPFAKVVEQAGLSQDKLLTAFARAGMVLPESRASAQAALAMPEDERSPQMTAAPLPDRFAPQVAEHEKPARLAFALADPSHVEIAYAIPETVPQEAAWGALARLTEVSLEDDGSDATDATNEGLPDSVFQPPARPKLDAPQPSRQAQQPARQEKQPAKPAAAEALAYARPDKPEGGVARAFKNLFDGPRRGNGVAIYDISAGMVYMPDGQKLEAHSGIGQMADNPRYVHVKMNGPTPPNTYKLSMREKRFHGVEAIRMTPVGDGKMHGRTGILAHSYLLRGGRAESHGCVAFKDYPRFLKAFKQGKVTQIVVVERLSRAPARVALNGRGV